MTNWPPGVVTEALKFKPNGDGSSPLYRLEIDDDKDVTSVKPRSRHAGRLRVMDGAPIQKFLIDISVVEPQNNCTDSRRGPGILHSTNCKS